MRCLFQYLTISAASMLLFISLILVLLGCNNPSDSQGFDELNGHYFLLKTGGCHTCFDIILNTASRNSSIQVIIGTQTKAECKVVSNLYSYPNIKVVFSETLDSLNSEFTHLVTFNDGHVVDNKMLMASDIIDAANFEELIRSTFY